MEGHIILSDGKLNNIYILFLPKGIYRIECNHKQNSR